MWRKRSTQIPDEERRIADTEKATRRTMERAVRLLAAKPRSVAELRDRLLEKNWTNKALVDGVIERLREYRYLDDDRFAADLAVSRLRARPQGKMKLRQALSRKKLAREIVDAAIVTAYEKLPEEELIDRSIEKRIRAKGLPKDRDALKKFLDHLLRQGFEYDLIRTKMAALPRTVTDTDDATPQADR